MTRVFARSVGGGLGLEELNQISDRGIDVFGMLRAEMGLARDEISEFGKTTEGARKITEALTNALDKRFGGATQKRLSNLNVAFSNFGIALKNFQDIVGESGFGQALKNITNTLTDAITDSDGLARSIGRVLGNIFNKINEFLIAFRTTGIQKLKEFLIEATRGAESFINGFKEGLKSIANAFIDIRNAVVFGDDLPQFKILKTDLSNIRDFIQGIGFDAEVTGTKFEKHFGKRLHDGILQKNVEKFTELKTRLKLLQNASREFGDTIARGFEDAVFEAKNLSEAIRQIGQDIIRLAYRKAITDPLGEALGGAIKTGIGSIIGGITGKATGGSVRSGTPYIVGEQGAELFVPGRSGTIVPNNAIGGGAVTVNQTINLMPSVTDSIRGEILNALPLIREQSVQAVIEARSRGGVLTKAMGLK